MPTPNPHLFLSPHLDDAALSCGGQIAGLTQAKAAVQVVTIFAGDAPADGLSPFAAALHQDWGLGPNPPALRRAEDSQALALLGADFTHLPHGDAIYRRGAQGLFYADREAIFGPPASEEAAAFPAQLAAELAALLGGPGQATLHAPLAVGRHVDHTLARAAALILMQAGHAVQFYEDYPYSAVEGQVEQALAELPPLRPAPAPYDEEFLALRLRAVGCYGSQLGVLFGGPAAMALQTLEHAAGLAQQMRLAASFAERVWLPA
ncbi:MAG: PIG-L family deacetylase [Chloroflexi bacterium]|nr:PIG-L family deacetylase [Chloroflexota bacterium]